MRHGHQLDAERANIEAAAHSNDSDGNFRRTRLARAFRLKQGGGERRGVDWHFQARPQVDQRAEMIFVRMREHQACDILALFDQVPNVRKDQVDPRKVLFGGKRHAEIDRKPRSPAIVTDPVDRQVHADLADPAKRRKYQFLWPGHTQRPPKPKTSPAVTGVTLPAWSSSRRPGVIETLETSSKLPLGQSHA